MKPLNIRDKRLLAASDNFIVPVNGINVVVGLNVTSTLAGQLYIYGWTRAYGRLSLPIGTYTLAGAGDYDILATPTSISGFDGLEFDFTYTGGSGYLTSYINIEETLGELS